jgi:putative oxidoreductase
MLPVAITRALPWVLRGLLTVGFLPAGLTKFLNQTGWVDRFATWGYGAWFVPVVGVLELVGLAALWIPPLTRYAVALLSILMLGAAYTHLTHPPQEAVLRPVLFLLVLGLLYWSLRRAGTPSTAPGAT